MPRRFLAILLLLVSAAALAGGWHDGNPTDLTSLHLSRLTLAQSGLRPSVHPPQARARQSPRPPQAPTLSASIAAMRAVSTDGAVVDLDLPLSADLRDALDVPPGTAELEIDLASPLRLCGPVSTPGRNFCADLQADLVVPLEDPDAGTVRVTLPAGADPDLLAAPEALLDALIATPG